MCLFVLAVPAAHLASEQVSAQAAIITLLCLRFSCALCPHSSHPTGPWLLAQGASWGETTPALPSAEPAKPARAFNFSNSGFCHLRAQSWRDVGIAVIPAASSLGQ